MANSVLMIGDDVSRRARFSKCLKTAGFSVSEAVRVGAVAKIKEAAPDVIVVDAMSPLDAAPLLAELHDMPSRRARVVVLSHASTETTLLARVKDASAFDLGEVRGSKFTIDPPEPWPEPGEDPSSPKPPAPDGSAT